jgi:hypothetical protein
MHSYSWVAILVIRIRRRPRVPITLIGFATSFEYKFCSSIFGDLDILHVLYKLAHVLQRPPSSCRCLHLMYRIKMCIGISRRSIVSIIASIRPSHLSYYESL